MLKRRCYLGQQPSLLMPLSGLLSFPTINNVMKAFFKFIYDFLFHDFTHDRVSHSKFWSNVGYGVLVWAFIHIVQDGKTEIDYMLFFLFAVAVVGNKSLQDYIKKP